MTKPLVLCILDGVGISRIKKHNAVAKAKMPFFRSLLRDYPNTELKASGAAVGLPAGVMGNSEVGHITIGAGRIVNQFLRRFQMEDWNKNKQLGNFIRDMKKRGGVVNLMGLMSDGQVHSDLNEIIFIAKTIAVSGLRIRIHFFSDGRDTPPKSAQKYINKLKRELAPEIKSGRAWFGTLTGRYYAMDRNHNMERTELAFDAIANGRAEFHAKTIDEALHDAYSRSESDEFIKPVLIAPPMGGSAQSAVGGLISKNDGIIFCNYRSDRARQILRMLSKTDARMLGFSDYGEGLDKIMPALLPDIPIKNTLGDILAANKISQLRIAETEKYNHVTYFFDAERTIDFPLEEKVLIPSPAVATFDLKPEMSAEKITDALLPRLKKFDVVILNYANGDMVGHTGIEAAAIKAMETLDAQLARLVPAVLKLNGMILITADHGNAEKMWNEKLHTPHTAHTTNKVPFIMVGQPSPNKIHPGGLSDITPTMLKILGLKQPREMTGKSLI